MRLINCFKRQFVLVLANNVCFINISILNTLMASLSIPQMYLISNFASGNNIEQYVFDSVLFDFRVKRLFRKSEGVRIVKT